MLPFPTQQKADLRCYSFPDRCSKSTSCSSRRPASWSVYSFLNYCSCCFFTGCDSSQMINGSFILQLHVKGLSGSFGVWVPDQSTKVFKRTTEFCLDSKENTGQLCLKNIWRLSKPESRSKPPLKGPGKMPMTDQEGAQSTSKHGHKNILGSNFFFFFFSQKGKIRSRLG